MENNQVICLRVTIKQGKNKEYRYVVSCQQIKRVCQNIEEAVSLMEKIRNNRA